VHPDRRSLPTTWDTARRANSFGPDAGTIHNGADDNASGTAGVLEIMQAFAALPEPPRRSVLFAFWDGEEKGLLGSKHLRAAYPTVHVSECRVRVQRGHDRPAPRQSREVFGARSAYGLRKLVSQEQRGIRPAAGLHVACEPGRRPLLILQHKVPFLMLHTGCCTTIIIGRRTTRELSSVTECRASRRAHVSPRLMTWPRADQVPGFSGRGTFRVDGIAEPSSNAVWRTPPPRFGCVVGFAVFRGRGSPSYAALAPRSSADRAGLRVGDR